MTPETKARQYIDQKLEQAGWVIQDIKQLNLGTGVGVAVREYPTDTGPADYVLFVNRNAVGVIEAKRNEAGQNIRVSGQLVPQDPSDEPASELLARIRAERAAQQAVKKPRGRKAKEAV